MFKKADRQYQTVPDESAPLAFLEKSHCVPILIALYRNGMMNRNQLYAELGQTINIVIKRIKFLKDRELIYEIEMKVKPFAKYIDLTGKGKAVAQRLSEIEAIVDRLGTGDIGFVHVHFPRQEVLVSFGLFEHEVESAIDFDQINWPDSKCTTCKKQMHLIQDKEEYNWICFKCGTRKKATKREAMEAWLISNYK